MLLSVFTCFFQQRFQAAILKIARLQQSSVLMKSLTHHVLTPAAPASTSMCVKPVQPELGWVLYLSTCMLHVQLFQHFYLSADAALSGACLVPGACLFSAI